LLFMGSGPLHADISRRAAELSVTHRIQILPGRPLEQIPEVMNALDVFVLPSLTTASWKEQFGRVLIEAGACATPVIGSSSGAIPDVIGGAGLVFDERNYRSLSEKIISLRNDPILAREFSVRGRKQA